MFGCKIDNVVYEPRTVQGQTPSFNKTVFAANAVRMEMVFGFLVIYSPFSSSITYFPKKPVPW